MNSRYLPSFISSRSRLQLLSDSSKHGFSQKKRRTRPATIYKHKDLKRAYKYNVFYKDFVKYAPLPDKFNLFSYQTLVIMLAIFLACLDSILYYLGAGDNELGKWLGIGINFPATVFFGIATAGFYANAIADPSMWCMLFWSCLIAVVSALPTTLSTFYLARPYGAFKQWGMAIAQFSGGYPLNGYAIYDSLNRIYTLATTNYALRDKLMQKFRECIEARGDPLLINMIPERRNLLTRIIGYGLGSGIGVLLVVALSGYYCAVAEVLTTDVGLDSDLAYILSLGLFNLPSELIAFLMTGIDQGTLLVNTSIDTTKILLGLKPLTNNKRDWIFDIIKAIVAGGGVGLGLYSYLTSLDLFGTCPNFGKAEDAVRFDVIYGTMVFNTLVFMVSQFKFINDIKWAYASDEDKERYLILSMFDFIDNANGKKTAEVLKEYFPETLNANTEMTERLIPLTSNDHFYDSDEEKAAPDFRNIQRIIYINEQNPKPTSSCNNLFKPCFGDKQRILYVNSENTPQNQQLRR